jgi:glycerate 2-kinase
VSAVPPTCWEASAVHVVVAPDSFGGTLTAVEAADALADGWLDARPLDRVTRLPLSDGGEGLLDVLAALHAGAERGVVEVADAASRPREVPFLWLGDGTVLVESAQVCGLSAVPVDERRPLEATSYGVGQLLAHVVSVGARRIVLGLGGTATVDAGSGALNGLGLRLTTAEGEGLRIGAASVGTCARVEQGWSRWRDDVELVLLADVSIPLGDAVARYGPQKGLGRAQVAPLAAGVARFAEVLTTRFPGPADASTRGSGAAGGLGFALAVALGGRLVDGAPWVAEQVGLSAALADADLVITGEGHLDATTADGKVAGHVAGAARAAGVPLAVVAGRVDPRAVASLGVPSERAVAAPSARPGPPAAAAVRRAAGSLAVRLASVPSDS